MRANALSVLLVCLVGLAGCSGDDFVHFDPVKDAGTESSATSDDALPDGCTMCNGWCADPQSDPSNCGTCGNVCPLGAKCVGGACACPPGSEACGKACKDTRDDVENCGACGDTCGAGKKPLEGGGTWACDEGKCSVKCDAKLSTCDTGCYDTKTNNQNCGACGAQCSGTCTDGTCCQNPSKGSCTHDMCTTGTALSSSCDGSQGCVAKVCAADYVCCLYTWDATCISEVAKYCSPLKCKC